MLAEVRSLKRADLSENHVLHFTPSLHLYKGGVECTVESITPIADPVVAF